jgi:putative drug exporter of the RND superfamily
MPHPTYPALAPPAPPARDDTGRGAARGTVGWEPAAAGPGGSAGPSHPGPRTGAAHAGRRPRPTVERIACWSARHRVAALLAWLALVAAAFLAGQLLGTQSRPSYDPGPSGAAERMLSQLHITTPATESVLIAPRDPGSRQTFPAGPQLQQATHQVVAALTALPSAATGIHSPFGPGGQALVSRDRHSVLVTFTVPGPHASADATVAADLAAVAAVQARHPGLIVTEAGSASTDRAGNALMSHDFRQAEATSVPITLLLLLVVFGALIAAGIPLLLAASAVMTAVSLLAIPSHWLPIGQGTSEVVLIIGMAVGVDYTLFYLRREREERAAGATFDQALRTAAATSGRAIVISGLTVMISLAGLFLTGIDMFTGFAVGTIAVVAVAVAGSLTVLPAVLSLLGPWADRGRIPFLGRARTGARPSRLWAALAGRVVRRPVLWGGLAAAALLALALPALGMRTSNPPIDLPQSLPVVRALADIQRAFPGGPAPAQVVVSGRGVTSPAMRHALAGLRSMASPAGPIRPPVTAAAVAGGRGLIVSVPLAGNGTDASSSQALLALRQRILPETLGTVHDARFAVTGVTANGYDFTSALRSAVPKVFCVVAVLAFLLLLVAFRSVAIPLISITLNLLSAGAAYGLITLIFQDGHLAGLLGFTSFGAITGWVPLFMFVFLFGLSMDYHVFILSRIREHWLAGATTRQAVTEGIASSAGVVTSAAVIMVAVFSIFATLSTVDLKTIGVGLAFAVFIDATVVRGICVPAALALLGERSWYLPRWLGRIPRGLSEPEPAAPGSQLPSPLRRHGSEDHRAGQQSRAPSGA